MSPYALKLVAVCFLKKPTDSMLLQQCEELYVHGVLSQLSRFSGIQTRDLATLPDRISLQNLQQDLSHPDTLARIQQICSSSRCQFLLTGSLSQSSGARGGVNINVRLYDKQAQKYILNETDTLMIESKPDHIDDALHTTPTEMNRQINNTVQHILQQLYQEDFEFQERELAPLSHSMQAMQLILRAHQTQSHQEKAMLYEAALREDAQLESAYYQLARLYKNDYQYEKSVLHYREALKVSQASKRNKAIYATEAGIACALLGRYDLALQWWQRAIEYDNQYINPYFNIANTYEDQEQYAQAEFYFLKAQELAPDDFRTFFNLARIYSKMGVWEKALTQYRFQLASEDGDPWCHSDVATCYLNLGDLNSAKHHLEKTLALDPEGEAGQYAQLILSGLG